jgi:hypothetical protein
MLSVLENRILIKSVARIFEIITQWHDLSDERIAQWNPADTTRGTSKLRLLFPVLN